MTKKWIIFAVLTALVLGLSGCSLLTLDELYVPPRRSEDYDNLQSVIEEAMQDLTYCAPIAGDHQQAVQTADLDGDGVDEYLLFAKGNNEMPLKILIFSQLASGYMLMDTIEGYGFAFDFVEYIPLDDRAGVEIVVGRQVSEELARSVSVYRFTRGFSQQLLSASYTRMLAEDLDGDSRKELLLLTAGESELGNGALHLYDYNGQELRRTAVVNISHSVSMLQRMESGRLADGSVGIFVTTAADQTGMTLDVFTWQTDRLVPSINGIKIPAVNQYLLYPADIDEDGIMEIPEPMSLVAGKQVVQWYALDAMGNKQNKSYVYHQMAEGWYLFLDSQWLPGLTVQNSSGTSRFLYNGAELFTVYALTNSDREDQAKLPGRIVLYRGDSTIYAAQLGQNAEGYGVTEELLKDSFHPVRMERNTDESGD